MKIVRYFIAGEDDTGARGFMPLWIPQSKGFNVNGSRGMIHDSLEHSLSDTGAPHQEIMAFGRILALRYEPAILATMRNTGHELHALMSNSPEFPGDWNSAIPDPGPVRMPSGTHQMRRTISDMVREVAKTGRREVDYGCGQRLSDVACTRVARWLALGYIDAQRRYGGYDGCSSLGWVADGWAERESRNIESMGADAEDGDVLCLTIDTKFGEIKTRLISDGQRLDWLRPRINHWRVA